MCSARKVPYVSPQAAHKARKQQEKHRRRGLRVYRCPDPECRMYHLTSNPDGVPARAR